MAVLIHKTIEELIKKEPPLIENHSEDSIEAASYDMKLGEEYIKEGKKTILTKISQTIVLKPGEFAILSSYEKINMPLNLIGHNGIMSKWARRGLVSLFSPQIDPGFEGILMVPVYNAGDSEISISLQDKIFTIEFTTTDKESEIAWSDSKNHGRQDRLNIEAQVPKKSKPIFEDIDKIDKKTEKLENKINNLEKDIQHIKETYNVKSNSLGKKLTIFGLIIAIFSLYLKYGEQKFHLIEKFESILKVEKNK